MSSRSPARNGIDATQHRDCHCHNQVTLSGRQLVESSAGTLRMLPVAGINGLAGKPKCHGFRSLS
jgi:hypothetical protein